jgi:putative transposase
MEWARILTYITGTVDHELLLRNEYLVAENRILRGQLLKFSDAERVKLGEIGRRLGRKALGEVETAALPDSILAWYRRLVARKFDGSNARRTPGRPRVDKAVEELIVRMAKENPSWGYDRIVGALANLGHEVSDQTVGNVLQRHGLPPAPERKHTTTWAAFIRAHLAVLAGTDFGGGPHAARTGDLLRAVFHSPREPQGGHRRDHRSPERAMDAANGPERDHGGMRCASGLSLSPA